MKQVPLLIGVAMGAFLALLAVDARFGDEVPELHLWHQYVAWFCGWLFISGSLFVTASMVNRYHEGTE